MIGSLHILTHAGVQGAVVPNFLARLRLDRASNAAQGHHA
jgi:hypothetical protein